MQFTQSLTQNHAFRRLYNKGKHAATGCIVLYCRRNNSGGNRLGITVSTKVGKAVVRNKVRRRLKEIYRLHESQLMPGFDLVIVARVRASEASYAQLEADFRRLVNKLDLRAKEKS